MPMKYMLIFIDVMTKLFYIKLNVLYLVTGSSDHKIFLLVKLFNQYSLHLYLSLDSGLHGQEFLEAFNCPKK